MEPATAENTTLGNISFTEKSFMEEVQDYLTFKIATEINNYWFIILVPIGFMGNTLSFLVMIKPSNRKMSTCIYMAGISINDNLMMCLALHNWLVSAEKIFEWHILQCKTVACLTAIGLQNSTYQIVAMTADKYIAIKWPHKAATYSTPGRAKLILTGVISCALIYNAPHLYASSLIGDKCLAYAVGGTITKVFSWATFIINGIIPFSLLIHMNYVIVKTVRKSREMFKGNVEKVGKENIPDKNKGMDTRQRIMKSAENQLTTMLLLVTILFLILLIPTYIRYIYLIFVVVDTPSKFASSMLFFQVTYKLFTTNNAINFFLYCVSGQKFRNDLKEILWGCGSNVRATTSLSDSNITVLST